MEGLMLKLKLQYFGHLMWRTDSLENTLMLEKIEGRRRRVRQRMRWLDAITDLMDMSLSKLGDLVMDGEVHWIAKSLTWLSDWTELNWTLYICATWEAYISIYLSSISKSILYVLDKRKHCSSGDLKFHSRVVKKKILSAQD